MGEQESGLPGKASFCGRWSGGPYIVPVAKLLVVLEIAMRSHPVNHSFTMKHSIFYLSIFPSFTFIF